MSIIVYVVKNDFSNWRSVLIAVEKIKVKAIAINLDEIILLPERSIIILPGVGNISSLSKYDFYTILKIRRSIIERDIRIIGICLGFQFMCSTSEENFDVKCLDIFKEDVVSLNSPPSPSVGWFEIQCANNKYSDEISKIINGNYFYLTHSYGVIAKNQDNFDYCYYFDCNGQRVVAAIIGIKFIGMQFHPEKSGKNGIDLLNACINYLL